AGRRYKVEGEDYDLGHGDVAIAAITSCTNTSNPSVLIAAGLVARNAVKLGLKSKPWVKTSLAPGSAAVAGYLARAGLQEHLDALGFNIAGFACVTCNGMSGPLAPEIEQAITSNGLACAAVLSGNRNFAGRIHPLAPASFLASPALVVAYALAGSTLIDLEHDPLGTDSSGAPVRLADLWPDPNEVARLVAETITPDLFSETRAHLFEGSPDWQALPTAGTRTLYDFGQDSTYLGDPPYFSTPAGSTGVTTIRGLRPLAILGDQITTDHIAPVGHIPETSPAGRYLIARGITPRDFNSYGTRRAQPDVVVRSVFANIRLRNEMVGGQEGGLTRLEPGGEVMAIYDAAERYRDRGEASIVIAGRDYGSGSSRDTAARACLLAGIRAVVAESFERIHRTNLINAGILPCELPAGTTRKTLRLDGTETFDLEDLPAAFADALACTLVVRRADGAMDRIAVHLRADTAEELETLRAGGLLPSIAGELGVH
ncbi:MAG: aconitate hydratase, partial [Hyphomicrobiaceae bacterium]|nr:aconitate hydratase [Hyphomicrobiaceae bacterium]